MAQNKIRLILLGVGTVGGVLLRQVLGTRPRLAQRTGLELSVVAAADSSGFLDDDSGLSDEVLRDVLQAKEQGRPLSGLPGARPLAGMLGLLRPEVVVADLTASQETAPLLDAAADVGCGVVLANKRPLARSWAASQTLLSHPHLRYEATVGAGLPVIATLRTLLDTGDEVAAIEGCMSGTLGYLCAQLEAGHAYSDTVHAALAQGYTEPDPREDLSGRDVARKALILARTADWPLEMADLEVELVYPDSLSGVTVQEFMAATPESDEGYARRFEAAGTAGKTLRYVARVGPDGGKVGLMQVDQYSLMGALRGPANYFAFHTTRYSEQPLVIVGPGAGPGVTAAGVLGDIVALALQQAHPPA